jgi:hypothetical protein
MEFSPRANRGNMPPQQHTSHPTRRKHIDWNGRAVRIEWFIFTSLVALILLLAIGWMIFTGNGSGESKRIDDTKYQAVFLNGGVTSGSVSYSTYFGHITKLNDKYVVLSKVYYLTDQSTQNGQSSPQLTKLGCQQLHSPYDEMVINRTQVAFWENLQDSGKVVQAIKQFEQQNPNGPNCSQTNSSGGSSPQNTSPSPSPNAR